MIRAAGGARTTAAPRVGRESWDANFVYGQTQQARRLAPGGSAASRPAVCLADPTGCDPQMAVRLSRVFPALGRDLHGLSGRDMVVVHARARRHEDFQGELDRLCLGPKLRAGLPGLWRLASATICAEGAGNGFQI